MKYLEMNVFDAAMARIDRVLDEFDNVFVSFSGGKDSAVLAQLTLLALARRGEDRQLGLMHLDYEAQYTVTTEFVTQTYARLAGQITPYWCCVPFMVTTCTSMHQSYWRPWEDEKRDIWVRPMPEGALTRADFDFYRPEMWDYDFQTQFARWLHEQVGARRTCALIGIRAQESLHRWRTIASDRNINKYRDWKWTTRVYDNVYNAYPIYDWQTEDIWTANARYGWPYNRIYDLMHMAGVPLGRQRVASPFLSASQDALKLYRAIDPDVWGRMVSRVNGVNFTAIYGGTKAMGWRRIEKPPHFTWQEYMNFLLDTLPPETARNYRDKLATSIKFWQTRGGVLSEQAIADLRRAGVKFEVGDPTNYKTDKLPVRMDYIDDIDSNDFPLIPTFKRMCACILNNDQQCKYMGFARTKQEQQRRNAALEKYSRL